MMRTRDEMRMTIDAYRTLYNSSVTFGIKKQLKAEEGLPDLVASAEQLEAEKAAQEHELQELRSKVSITYRTQDISLSHRTRPYFLHVLTSFLPPTSLTLTTKAGAGRETRDRAQVC